MQLATLGQGNQAQSLLIQKKVPVQKAQQLFTTGALAKLFDAAKAGTLENVNLFDLCRVLGLADEDILFHGESVEVRVNYHPDFDLCSAMSLRFGNHARNAFEHIMEDELGPSDPTLCLASVDKGEAGRAFKALRERNYRLANRRDMIAFLEKVRYENFREEEFTGRIILGGSVIKDVQLGTHGIHPRLPKSENVYEYPYITFKKGEFGDCGLIKHSDPIFNGTNNGRIPVIKDFFLIGLPKEK